VCDRVFFLSGGVITRAETLRGLARITVVVTLLGGSFDAGAIARAAGATPIDNVLTITVDSDADVAALVRRVVESGAGIIDVRRQTADLESIFRGVA
ncbi:MAG TPA: hypothetical protein VN605_15310, partial [Thermoanaerobaculia bacterium]|nr:hypothetical protein [Thermoanaerobaculia bacterium]